MEYEYKVHELTAFARRFNRQTAPCFLSETNQLLRSIDRCLDKADQLDLKIVGVKLSEAREALKDIQIDK